MKQFKFVLLLMLILLAMSAQIFAGEIVEQKSVLTGKVLADELVVVGQPITQGTVIVNVDTIAGKAAASRCNLLNGGKVVEVLVKVGDIIRVGQIVARIEAK